MNSIFLRVEGIVGESKDTAHQKWLDVDTWSWGINRGIGSENASRSHYLNLSVHCKVDKATPAMMLKASAGNKIKTVELSACKSGGEQFEYYRITLENVLIAQVLLRDNGIVTNVDYELQADKVNFQYWEQTELGVKGAETRMAWDIKNASSKAH